METQGSLPCSQVCHWTLSLKNNCTEHKEACIVLNMASSIQLILAHLIVFSHYFRGLCLQMDTGGWFCSDSAAESKILMPFDVQNSYESNKQLAIH
jgi:hypothetical protein